MKFFPNKDEKQMLAEQKMFEQEQKKRTAQDSLQYDISQQQLFDSLGEGDTTDLVSVTLDPTNLIKDIENLLRGRVYVGHSLETGKPQYRQNGEQVMNEIGINAVLQEIIARVNKVTTLSAITQDEKSKIMFIIHKQLALLLAANHKRFEVHKSRRSQVLWQISHFVYFNISRAVGGIERRELYGRHRAIEHLQRTEQSQQPSKLPIFGGFNQ